jgi:2-polyprenyl-3-methyl-5-hydroxy-6-metoxy-1,4-benzoquinol methylase
MVTANTGLSSEDAERFRSFERRQHDSLAASYHDFFTPVRTLVIKPLPETVRLHAAAQLLDVATGPGSVAAEAQKRGARPIGIDISPGMIALPQAPIPVSISGWQRSSICRLRKVAMAVIVYGTAAVVIGAGLIGATRKRSH